METADLIHLTFKPPFVPGSYNRAIGVQMERMTEFRQKAISYWDGASPDPGQLGVAHTILATPDHLSWRQKLFLQLPCRVRRKFGGIGARDWLIYVWKMLPALASLQPKVVMCYDAHHLGPLLRRSIDWPCRLILSQHGLSYFLDAQYLRRVYSLQSFDAVHTLSRVSYECDRTQLAAYEPEVTVLPNWVDTTLFKPATVEEKRLLRAKWGLPEDRPVVLWLSRLVPSKGAHLLISSWPRIVAESPGALLWVVGGPDPNYAQFDYGTYLRALVEAAGLGDSVRFVGAVPPDSTAECYRAADAYVFPTLAAEGCGLTLLEAMACGLPCVVSDYPVGREMFSQRDVMFVPDPNLADSFARPVIQLLSDSAHRAHLGCAAREVIEQRYSYDRVAPQIAAFYERQISMVEDGRRMVNFH